MSARITNVRSLKNFGIFADRDARTPTLAFKRFNLIYGFNGSGKSTLSRLFASLRTGERHPRLPDGGAFEVELDDGTAYGTEVGLQGLESRLVVFNGDYIDENLQWSLGRASPVFFIGANQAEAAAELAKVEIDLAKQARALAEAEAKSDSAVKTMTLFKRERAREIAGHLHLVGRKYEAPTLVKDLEAWAEMELATLDADTMSAVSETLRLTEPPPPIEALDFDPASVIRAYDFILEICGKSMGSVALEEIQRFPEMLLWLRQGLDVHRNHDLATCLLCGNGFSNERRDVLAAALDQQVEQFVDMISRTSVRLQTVLATIDSLMTKTPEVEDVVADQRPILKDLRPVLLQRLGDARQHLASLSNILAAKQSRPAVPADVSGADMRNDVVATVEAIARDIAATNETILAHNAVVGDFANAKRAADERIRKHFIAACRSEFDGWSKEVSDAQTKVKGLKAELEDLRSKSASIRAKIREHGPAAGAINKLVGSYLGHSELSISPVEEGYELHRHGSPIRGLPSEGEKTAIALSYFLSSLEADGRKLKDLILVIDDPVSSLDTKALNFACSLVRSRTAEAGQLFVLTHNLQCMGEFRKAWRSKARLIDGKGPSATLSFIDVTMAEGSNRRNSKIVPMSKLLREYDSEYHFLFSHVIGFTSNPEAHYEHGYMMPNILRRVLDVFLAFKCPGSSGLSSQMEQLYGRHKELDRDKLTALERLSQAESHSDNLDDLLSFSSMTIEETRQAALALLEMMEKVDPPHLASLRKLCA